VEAGWKGWMGRVCNWTETRFSVMVHSLASPDRSPLLLGPGGPGQPHPAGAQPDLEPGAPEGGRGGAMRQRTEAYVGA